ncbi:MAG TPA: hypothetical protein VG099_13920 [Gemmataceae bacterium]|nr:hypothetical protein [Gemmataceae bacterium]
MDANERPQIEKGKKYKLTTARGVQIVVAIGPDEGGKTWLVREGNGVFHASVTDLVPLDEKGENS